MSLTFTHAFFPSRLVKGGREGLGASDVFDYADELRKGKGIELYF